jgi:hypothetical protein
MGQAECGPLSLAEIVFGLAGPLNKLSPREFLVLFYLAFCIICIIILLENCIKFLENFLMLSLNKWNQQEIYSEITFDWYEFLLTLWDYLIAYK